MTFSLEQWSKDARYLDFEGHQIAWWSEGSGRPLLLVHGYPTASWDWHRVWDTLAEDHQLIACDMLGFGFSDKPRSGYSIHRQADLQEALLDSLGITEFDALVHDYGVSVGQELLARQLEGSGATGLGRIAFLNGGIFPEQHRPAAIQKLGVSPLGFLMGKILNRRRFGRTFSGIFGPETQPDATELDEFWQLITHNEGLQIAHILLHYLAERRNFRERWVGALQRSPIPRLLVNGGADPISGRHMYERFRELVPNAGAICLDRIGHYPQTEAPDQVLAEIRPFFSA